MPPSGRLLQSSRIWKVILSGPPHFGSNATSHGPDNSAKVRVCAKFWPEPLDLAAGLVGLGIRFAFVVPNRRAFVQRGLRFRGDSRRGARTPNHAAFA